MAENKCTIRDECYECEGTCTAFTVLDLLPCPFCGSKNLRIVDCTMDDPCYQIMCDECGGATFNSESFIIAKDAWNKRKTPTPEQLEGVAKDLNKFYGFGECVDTGKCIMINKEEVSAILKKNGVI